MSDLKNIKESRTKLIQVLTAENNSLIKENEDLKRKLRLYDSATIITEKESGTDEILLANIESEFFGSFGLR